MERANAQNGSWSWADGLDSNFTNWAENASEKVGQCGALLVNTRKWVPKDCADRLNFVCKRDANETALLRENPTWEC